MSLVLGICFTLQGFASGCGLLSSLRAFVFVAGPSAAPGVHSALRGVYLVDIQSFPLFTCSPLAARGLRNLLSLSGLCSTGLGRLVLVSRLRAISEGDRGSGGLFRRPFRVFGRSCHAGPG